MIVHPQNGKDPIDLLIDTVYPNLIENSMNITFIMERAKLTPLNNDVDEINGRIMAKYPGEQYTYYSFDSTPEDKTNLYPIEYLNSITSQGLPPHELTLKVNAPIMLFRNLDLVNRLCNRTRLICQQFQSWIIDTEIITENHQGKCVFIPRILLMSTEDTRLPFVLKRKQFPVWPAFALTINKSQGQMLPYVDLYLPWPIFSHGQLYVTMSRVHKACNLNALVNNRTGRNLYKKHCI
nr:1468_t:CDS:1 [Entrophospora candida]